MRYLRQLKQYWEVMWPRACDAKYLIQKSLSETLSDWWLIIKNDVTDLDSFVTKFQKRYWNEYIQHENRKKLEFGFFQPAKDKSRTEYAGAEIVYKSEQPAIRILQDGGKGEQDGNYDLCKLKSSIIEEGEPHGRSLEEENVETKNSHWMSHRKKSKTKWRRVKGWLSKIERGTTWRNIVVT